MLSSLWNNIDQPILDEENDDQLASIPKIPLDKISNASSSKILGSSPVKGNLVKGSKNNKNSLVKKEENVSGPNSARDNKSSIKEKAPLMNKKISEVSSLSSGLHKLNSAVYEHNIQNNERHSGSPQSNLNRTGGDINIKLDPASLTSQKDAHANTMKKGVGYFVWIYSSLVWESKPTWVGMSHDQALWQSLKTGASQKWPKSKEWILNWPSMTEFTTKDFGKWQIN